MALTRKPYRGDAERDARNAVEQKCRTLADAAEALLAGMYEVIDGNPEADPGEDAWCRWCCQYTTDRRGHKSKCAVADLESALRAAGRLT